ncbi:sensor histidine kinase [Microbacterium sp. B2969]|uniref:histidine kinase n=1 Tax=Microbacterium alkaliflavum TaxID=3248839 RepID=A0ABW7QEW6_9MICO
MRPLTQRLSIRWRITIGSVVVGAILLALAAVVFHAQIANVQLNADKKLLYDATTSYLTAINDHPDQIDPPSGEQHLAVVRPDGSIAVDNLPDSLTDRLDDLTALGSGSHLITAANHEYLIVVRTVDAQGGRWYVVASHDQRFAQDVLANLTNILYLGVAILLFGIGVASWVLTTAALRPVARMRATAESIIETGSADELPVGEARDELYDLATTLNSLIRNVRTTAAREKQMVADASHELRTPIAILRGQLELAQGNTSDAAAHARDLTAARATAERISALATSLLQLSTLEANDDPTLTGAAELAEEFRSASDRARLIAPEKNLDIDFDSDIVDDAAVVCRISVLRFGQLLDNLLSNSVRLTPPGGTIHVSLAQDGSGLRLAVADTGPGIPSDFAAVAFDRFSRPEHQRGGDGGSGLGLAIVAAIVANASGTVQLANGPDGGLLATVLLPAQGAAG